MLGRLANIAEIALGCQSGHLSLRESLGLAEKRRVLGLSLVRGEESAVLSAKYELRRLESGRIELMGEIEPVDAS